MKISIKFSGSDEWEEIELLSEESGIQAIRIDDVTITEDSIRCRELARNIRENVSTDRQRPLQTLAGSAHKRENFLNSHFYGIMDVIAHRISTIEGPLHAYLGRDGEQLKERDMFEFIHPADCDSTQRMLATLLEGQSVIDFPVRMITAYGDYLSLSLTASTAEDGVAAFYASIMEEGKTKQHERVYGYKPRELLGHNHFELVPEKHHEQLSRNLKGLRLGNKAHSNRLNQPIEFERIYKGGKAVLVEMLLTHFDTKCGKYQLLEREVENRKNVTTLTVNAKGNILACGPLKGFLK